MALTPGSSYWSFSTVLAPGPGSALSAGSSLSEVASGFLSMSSMGLDNLVELCYTGLVGGSPPEAGAGTDESRPGQSVDPRNA